MWQTLGHASAKTVLDVQLRRGSIAHAYLFVGPDGIGKRTLSTEFAEKVVGVTGPHPDITVFDFTVNNSVADARTILEIASYTPAASEKKVLVLTGVDTLTPSAANALLKTLEEPSASTVLLLTATTEAVLPTILSRCQVFRLQSLSATDMQAFASRQTPQPARELVQQAAGSPGLLTQLITDPALAQTITQLTTSLETGLTQTDGQRLALLDQFADLDESTLNTTLMTWLLEQQLRLTQQPQRYTLMRLAVETIQKLQTPFNKKLVLEHFLLHSSL